MATKPIQSLHEANQTPPQLVRASEAWYVQVDDTLRSLLQEADQDPSGTGGHLKYTDAQLSLLGQTWACIDCNRPARGDDPVNATCPVCSLTRTMCERHITMHLGLAHPNSPSFRERRNSILRKEMREGQLASFHTQQEVVTADAVTKNTAQSAHFLFFEELLHMPGAAILTFRNIDPNSMGDGILDEIHDLTRWLKSTTSGPDWELADEMARFVWSARRWKSFEKREKPLLRTINNLVQELLDHDDYRYLTLPTREAVSDLMEELSGEPQRDRMIYRYQQRVSQLLEALQLRPYNWGGNDHLSLFCAPNSDIQFLPTDFGPEEESVSTLTFPPGFKSGKRLKRNRLWSLADMAFANHEASVWPLLNLGSGLRIRLQAINTRLLADGSGIIKSSVYRRMRRLGRARRRRNVVGVQLRFVGRDYAMKGDFIIVPDKSWRYPDADIVMDDECLVKEIRCQDYTVGKANHLSHEPNLRYTWLEPLGHYKVTTRIIHHEDLGDQVIELAHQVNERIQTRTFRDYLDEANAPLDLLEDPDPDRRIRFRQGLEKRITSSTSGDQLVDIFRASGYSPFSHPEVMSRLTSGTARHWTTRADNAGRRPGIMVSGELLRFWYAPFADHPLPDPGHARLIWHPEHTDQLTAVDIAEDVLRRYNDALDHPDRDDHMSVIFIQEQDDSPRVLILRTPLSVDGGLCLPIDEEDAQRARQAGYHFYPRLGDKRSPDLHRRYAEGDTDIPQGKQPGDCVVEPALNPREIEDPPPFPLQEQQAVTGILELMKFRTLLGNICDAQAALDYSERYQDEKHKLNFSDVLDATGEGNFDPTRSRDQQYEDLLLPIYQQDADAALDISMSDRLAPHLIAYHAEKLEALTERAPQSDFEDTLLAYTQRRGAYLEIPEAQVSLGPRETLRSFRLAREILDTQARTFRALTAGPNWWFDTFSQELVDIVAQAFDQRTVEWQLHFDEDAQIKEDRNLDRFQRQAATFQQEAETKEREKELLIQAYQEAIATPDYRDGQFAALWVILMYTRKTRWKNQARFFTVPLYTLEYLPWEEIHAYHAYRPSPPVAMARAQRRINLQPGTKCRIQVSGEAQQTRYHLVDTAGDPMIRVFAESRHLVGLELEFLGYAPGYHPDPDHAYQDRTMLFTVDPQDLVDNPVEATVE